MATKNEFSIGEDLTITVLVEEQGIDFTTAHEIRFLLSKPEIGAAVLITKTKIDGGIVPTSASVCGVLIETTDTAELAPGLYVVDVWVQQTAGIDRRVVRRRPVNLLLGLEIPSV